MTIVGVLLVFFPLLTLAFALLNLLTWPRGKVTQWPGRVSVLVPARNEEKNLEACVRAIVASGQPIHELLVYDDGSTDRTPEILARLREEIPFLRTVEAVRLPAGWVGKAHACHRLALAATGDVLFFVDADVRVAPGGLGRALDLLDRLDAGVLTAVPRQIVGTFFERLVLPLLHVIYVAWYPLVLTWKSRDPRFLAANGQLLAVRRAAYDAIGGFEAVKSEVVDDMAFCRRAKERGLRVVFADGFEMASCRMYHSADEVVRGFSKNLYEGVGASLPALAVVLALQLLAFVVPFALGAWVLSAWALAEGTLSPEMVALVWPAVIGVGANVLLRAALAVRMKQPLEGVLLQPIAVLALVAIATSSVAWQLGDRVEWRGRVYAGRARRARDV